jgi:hypothetical protein
MKQPRVITLAEAKRDEPKGLAGLLVDIAFLPLTLLEHICLTREERLGEQPEEQMDESDFEE